MIDNRARLAGEAKMAIRRIEQKEIETIMKKYCEFECMKDQYSEEELFGVIANKMAFYESIIERHFDKYLPH